MKRGKFLCVFFLCFVASLCIGVVACSNDDNRDWDKIENNQTKSKQAPIDIDFGDIDDVVFLEDKSFVVTANGGSNDQPIEWSIIDISTQIGVATVDSDGTVYIHKQGSFRIKATKQGDDQYDPVSATSQYIKVQSQDDGNDSDDGDNDTSVPKKQEQERLIISAFDGELDSPLSLEWGDDDFVIKVGGGSVADNKPELGIVGNDSVATLNRDVLSIVGIGKFQLTAFLDGNQDYNSTTAITPTITVAKRKLTIEGTTVQDKIYDGSTDIDIQKQVSGGVLHNDLIGDAISFEFVSAKAQSADVGNDIKVEIKTKLKGKNLDNYSFDDTVLASVNILPQQLVAPKVTQQANTRVVEWQAIPNATSYQIKLDQKVLPLQIDADTLKWQLQNDTAGVHQVAIQATVDDPNYVASEWSNVISVTLAQLDTPSLSFDDKSKIVSVDNLDTSIAMVEWSTDGTNFSTALSPLTQTTTVHARLLPIVPSSLWIKSKDTKQEIVFLDTIKGIVADFETASDAVTLQWESVLHATSYNLVIDQTSISTTDITHTIDLLELYSVQFDVSIQAVGDKFSVPSDTVVYSVAKDSLIGDGTLANPYIILSHLDLIYANSNQTAHFALGRDISLPNGFATLTPQGFAGTLNGNGHTIINLTHPSGLFAIISKSGRVHNLNLQANINTDQEDNIGILASKLFGIAHDISVSGSVQAPNSTSVGGLVGLAENATIYNIANNANLHAKSQLGGIVGYAKGVQIAFVYNKGELSSLDTLGGLVGLTDKTTILASYNVGKLYASKMSAVGGIVGKDSSNSTIIGNYNIGEIYNQDRTQFIDGGGIVGSAQSQDEATKIADNIYIGAFSKYAVSINSNWEKQNHNLELINYKDNMSILNEATKDQIKDMDTLPNVANDQYFLSDGTLWWQWSTK